MTLPSDPELVLLVGIENGENAGDLVTRLRRAGWHLVSTPEWEVGDDRYLDARVDRLRAMVDKQYIDTHRATSHECLRDTKSPDGLIAWLRDDVKRSFALALLDELGKAPLVPPGGSAGQFWVRSNDHNDDRPIVWSGPYPSPSAADAAAPGDRYIVTNHRGQPAVPGTAEGMSLPDDVT